MARSGLSSLTLTMLALSALGAVNALTAGCKATPAAPAAGHERGPCYGNHTCDDGLACLSDLCVRAFTTNPKERPPTPPPATSGIDCSKVAEQLGFALLDNYTPAEARAAFVTSMQTECTAAGLTPAEAACLSAATTRQAVSACPRRFGVPDCSKIVAQLRGLLPPADPYIMTTADRVADRCKTETPPKAYEMCVLSAKVSADLDRCTW